MTTAYYRITADISVSSLVATITPSEIIPVDTDGTDGTAISSLYSVIATGGDIKGNGDSGVVNSISSAGVITTSATWYGSDATDAVLTVQNIPRGTALSQSTNEAIATFNNNEAAISECVRALDDTSVANAFLSLDGQINSYVLGVGTTTPPTTPSEGDAYVTGTSSTGAWSGYDNYFAYYINGGYVFKAPYAGMTVYNSVDGYRYTYDGSSWDVSTLPDSGVTAGTYKSVTVTSKGIVSAGTNPTTLSGYGITDAVSTTLASGKILVGNSSNVAAAVSPSGDVTIDNTGATTVGKIGGHSVSLGGALNTGGAVTLSGAYASIINVPGAYTWTLPAVTGTLAALGLAQTWSAAQTFSNPIALTTTYGAVSGLTYSSTYSGTTSTAGLYFDWYGTGTYGTGTTLIAARDYIGATAGGIRLLSQAKALTFRSVAYGTSAVYNDFYNASEAVCIRITDTGILPYITNSLVLGNSTYVFASGYIQAAWNVTSDANYKTDIAYVSATDALLYIGWALAAAVRSYKLKDAVAAKGDAARTHFGWIAQEVVTAFSTYGLDAFAYGCVGYDETWETTTVVTDSAGKETSRSVSREESDAVTADTSGATQTTDNNGNTTTVVATIADGITTTITTVRTCRYNVRMEEINALVDAALYAKIAGTFPSDSTSDTTTTSTDSSSST